MIVGVDVSSKRVDLAWLENGKPQRWHQQLDPKAHLIDRLRSIRVQWPGETLRMDGDTMTLTRAGADVTDIAIEYPFGRGNAIAALMATVGVITRQAPPWSRVAWPSSGELRQAIGARNTKDSAHDCLMHIGIQAGWWYIGDSWSTIDHGWDEHELDALVAAVGWQRILAAQDAA